MLYSLETILKTTASQIYFLFNVTVWPHAPCVLERERQHVLNYLDMIAFSDVPSVAKKIAEQKTDLFIKH